MQLFACLRGVAALERRHTSSLLVPLSFEGEGDTGGEVDKNKARNLFYIVLQYVTLNA